MSLDNEISKILCENSDTQIFFADNSEDIGNFTDSVIKKNTDGIGEFIDQLMNTNNPGSEGEKSGETSEGNEESGSEESEGNEEELTTESLTEETSDNVSNMVDRGILLFSLICSIIIAIIIIKSIKRPKVYQYSYSSTGDYDNYDHNSGEAWDFEDAKMYRDTKQKFGKDAAFENAYEQDYTYRDQSSYNQNSYNQNNNQSASSSTNMFDAMFEGLSPEKAREVYISLTKSFHSDNGGDDSKMGELNAAYDNYKKYNK